MSAVLETKTLKSGGPYGFGVPHKPVLIAERDGYRVVAYYEQTTRATLMGIERMSGTDLLGQQRWEPVDESEYRYACIALAWESFGRSVT